jgi:ethanolamine permease
MSAVRQETAGQAPELQKSLGPWTLWGLGVGYVIAGEYFGWNIGLPAGGTGGLLVAFVLVTIMYIAFVLSYAELACAIPKAGGGFVYALRGLGRFGGYMTGITQLIEFVFAPPAIAMALGAYAQMNWSWMDPKLVAILSLSAFTALNLIGVKQAAIFELVVTVLAVGELLLFMGVTAPHVRAENLLANAWPSGWTGIIAALPFAVWFYLAIEGVANAAEETKNPQRNVLIGFGTALATLVFLAGGVLICAVGVGGWERVVYAPDQISAVSGQLVIGEGAKASDSPLPLALGQIMPPTHPLYQLLIGIGGLGLICSLNGIIFAAGRSLFEMGRAGYLPAGLGTIQPRTHAPWVSLVVNWALGVLAVLFFDTAGMIIISAMGAALLYILSMEALVQLRRKEPELPRPYRVPFYPLMPRLAQWLAIALLLAMLWQNLNPNNWRASLSLHFFACLFVAAIYYVVVVRRSLLAIDRLPEQITSSTELRTID